MRDFLWNIVSIFKRKPIISSQQETILYYPILDENRVTDSELCWKGLWKKFLFLVLVGFVLGNSLTVAITYFQSANDFLFHNKVLDHQLTEGVEEWERMAVIVDGIMCAFIFLSNQIGMFNPIAKFFNQICNKMLCEIDRSPAFPKIYNILTWVGSICKSVISSTSLLSSIRDYTKEWIGSSICAFFACLANFGATFVILKEHSYDRQQRPWRAMYGEITTLIISFFISIGYGLSQGFLYQNALYNPFILMGVLKERPLLTDTRYLALNLPVGLAWVIFIYVTGKTLFLKSKKVLGSNYLTKDHPVTCIQKCNGFIASSFRWLGLAAAIFGFVLFLSRSPEAAIVVAGLSLIAAPGVLAIFTLKEKQEPLLSGNYSGTWSNPSINTTVHQSYQQGPPPCFV